jgi:DNA polymerase-1
MQGSLFGGETTAAEATPHAFLQLLAPVLEDAGIKKTGHDLKRLWLWLRAAGIQLRGLSCDTLIAGYLIGPTGHHTPTDLCRDYLQASVEFPELTALWRAGDTEALATAAGEQAQWLRRLEEALRVGLAEYDLMPLFRDVEMPLIPVLAEMEWLGIALDVEHLQELSLELGKTIHQVEGEIYRLAGEQFTVNSPKQLQVILYEKLKLPTGRKTKTGYSTDADALASLADKHAIVQQILTYRELTKLKSTYVDSLPRLRNPRTGRIHTHFNQAVTATGRLSSSDPNLKISPSVRRKAGRFVGRSCRAYRGGGCWPRTIHRSSCACSPI